MALCLVASGGVDVAGESFPGSFPPGVLRGRVSSGSISCKICEDL